MKKLAILLGLALELAVCGCGNNTPRTVTNTSTSGNWEAQMISQAGGQASLLNFVVAFNVTNSGPLDITGFGFFNQGSCFTNGVNGTTETGNASFSTSSSNQVTGTLTLTIKSATNDTVLTLGAPNPGTLTGTSNGTTTTTGTLSNGIVVGTWSLSGSDPKCNGGGDFIMCQGKATCVAP